MIPFCESPRRVRTMAKTDFAMARNYKRPAREDMYPASDFHINFVENEASQNLTRLSMCM